MLWCCGCAVWLYLQWPGRAGLDSPEPFAEGQELAQTAQRGARHDGTHQRDRIVRTRLSAQRSAAPVRERGVCYARGYHVRGYHVRVEDREGSGSTTDKT